MLRSVFTKSLRNRSFVKFGWSYLPSFKQFSSVPNPSTFYRNSSHFVQKRYINVKREMKEIHCCSGCGVQLQFMKTAGHGYIPQATLEKCLEMNEKPICQRCHRVFVSNCEF